MLMPICWSSVKPYQRWKMVAYCARQRVVLSSLLLCLAFQLPCQRNTIGLEPLDVGVDFRGHHCRVAFDSIIADLLRDIRSVLRSYHWDRDRTVHPGYRESTSVFMHDLPIVSCHDSQKKNMISKGDGLADGRHSKLSHERRTQ